MGSGQTTAPRVRIRRLGMPGDLGWVVMVHGELYAQAYGWDERFEAEVARIVADYAGHRDDRGGPATAAWIAEVDAERAGCIMCVADLEPGTAKLRTFLVLPQFRGLGAGAALVAECLGFARAQGYRRMTLATNGLLESAQRMYAAAGFRLVAEAPETVFGDGLTSQTWELEL